MPSFLVEDLAILVDLLYCLFIFFHVAENEPKEDARVPLDPARRRGDRSTRKLAPLSAELRQSACLIPFAPPMLGAGQREIQNPKAQKPNLSPFRRG
jgi:hypothetical protein